MLSLVTDIKKDRLSLFGYTYGRVEKSLDPVSLRLISATPETYSTIGILH